MWKKNIVKLAPENGLLCEYVFEPIWIINHAVDLFLFEPEAFMC